MIIESVILLAIIAGICSLDMTAFGQFMICRPIFCAPLFGFLMGDINTGLWVGMIVEMVWINAIPMGASVPIDISVIAILATSWACKFFPEIQSAAIWGIVLAIPFAYLYKEIDVANRKFNIKIMHWVEKGIDSNKEGRINTGVLLGLLVFFLKGFIFYLFAIVVGGLIYQILYFHLSQAMLSGLQKAWYLLPMLGFGAVIYNFRNIKTSFTRVKK